MTYNSWENHATWCVALWVNNERSTYDYWRSTATECRDEAATSIQVTEWRWSLEEAARFLLAERLKAEMTADTDLVGVGLYTDLLNAAFEEVNWPEIADELLEDAGQTSREGRASESAGGEGK